MSGNLARQAIFTRDTFSNDERYDIYDKANDRCAHCGNWYSDRNPLTIDHFVPLSKGGTNRDINLIPLCHDCNQEKSNYIYEPKSYLKFLKPKELEKLTGYFGSYIQSFDYLERTNLLSCDRYPVTIQPMSNLRFNSKNANKIGMHCWLKRAEEPDLDAITDYYVQYLTKNDVLESKELARQDIEFWSTFSCLYYLEYNGQIKGFLVASIRDLGQPSVLAGLHTPDGSPVYINRELCVTPFVASNNATAYTITGAITEFVTSTIIKEQSLPCLALNIRMLQADRLCYYFMRDFPEYHEQNTGVAWMESLIYRSKTDEMPRSDEMSKVTDFFNKFRQINYEEFNQWMERHDIPSDAQLWYNYEIRCDSEFADRRQGNKRDIPDAQTSDMVL